MPLINMLNCSCQKALQIVKDMRAGEGVCVCVWGGVVLACSMTEAVVSLLKAHIDHNRYASKRGLQ